jgi:hypothetical protein
MRPGRCFAPVLDNCRVSHLVFDEHTLWAGTARKTRAATSVARFQRTQLALESIFELDLFGELVERNISDIGLP